ncbi:glycosyltransferase family 4 protein [Brevundimonas sp.]|uniref:glycosyltransferase family 4 protein n=1 Tax=Brevundimonas sp. TaxID=1871086 RepID=UPI0037BEAC0D
MPKGSGALFFDVTTLMNNNGRVTGITRVEMCLTHDMLNRSNVNFIAWHQTAGRFFKPDRELVNFIDGPSYKDLDYDRIEFIEFLPRGSKLLIQGNAWLQNESYVDDLDVLVSRSDIDLTLLIHDILPVSHSQYFATDQVKSFEKCLDRMVGIASRFLVDSEATATELRAYLLKHRGKAPSIEVIRLGDGFQGGAPAVAVSQSKLPDVVRTALNEGRFVLSVGALSPHKNRRLLYDVWGRLYEELGDDTPTLLIAGGTAGAGPEGEQLAERLKRDERTKSHVHIVHGLDDAALELLYRRSLFTVFPSLCEGWGLPVAESLLNGKICIASSTSSMKEIAPDCTDLLDPLDTLAWVESAMLYAGDAKARSAREAFIRKNYRPTPWSETVDQLIAGSKGPARVRPPYQAYVGQVLDLASLKLLAKLGEPGQPQFEAGSWGGWTSSEATLTLEVAKTSSGMCEIVFQTAFQGRSGVVRVFNADKEIAVWRYDRSAMELRAIEIEETSLSVNAALRFIVEGDEVGARFGVAKLAILQSDWPVEKRDNLVEKLAPHRFAWGEPVALSDLKSALVSGWHRLEKALVWSNAGPATLLMPLSSPPMEGGVLRLGLSTLVNQMVGVAVNGVDMGNWNVGPKGEVYEIPLQSSLVGSLLWLEIRPSTTWKPSALVWSNDNRSLGIALSQIELIDADVAFQSSAIPALRGRRKSIPDRGPRPTAASSPNGVFEFTSEGNGREALLQGWHEMEAGHVWSTGSCSLQIAPPKPFSPRLRVTLSAYLPQTVEMFVNGRSSALWWVSDGEPQVFEADVSESVSPHDSAVTIDFIATAAVPAVMSDTPDGRALGVALGRLWFEGVKARPPSVLVKRAKAANRMLRRAFLR